MPHITTQAANLGRVAYDLAPAIETYRNDMGISVPFHAQDLRDYVDDMTGHTHAPASADRILRLLRRKGVLDYKVVSRSKSLYKFVENGTTEFFGAAHVNA